MKTRIKLRLYVTDQSPSSREALATLQATCEDPLIQRDYDIDIEVVDVQESPDLAEADQVLATPTVIKKLPPPVRRVVGDLADRREVFFHLEIEDPAEGNRSGNGETGSG